MSDSSGEARRLPALVAHADWSANAAKRWLARARLRDDGTYVAGAPTRAGDASSLLRRLADEAGGGCALVGFDFPIGVPVRYADAAGIEDFLALLAALGDGDWADLPRVAERADEIAPGRPFYPFRPGGTKRMHLLRGLALERWDDLRRLCELGRPDRRAAAPLFYTMGPQQVGKAALSGWLDVLAPALRDESLAVRIWPFAGPLDQLLAPASVVVAETYPAEFYCHLGLRVRKKGDRRERAANATALLECAERARLDLAEDLRAEIESGFAHDDAFDAVVGLFGMLNVVLGRRDPGEPRDDEAVVRVEGWILGQQAAEM